MDSGQSKTGGLADNDNELSYPPLGSRPDTHPNLASALMMGSAHSGVDANTGSVSEFAAKSKVKRKKIKKVSKVSIGRVDLDNTVEEVSLAGRRKEKRQGGRPVKVKDRQDGGAGATVAQRLASRNTKVTVQDSSSEGPSDLEDGCFVASTNSARFAKMDKWSPPTVQDSEDSEFDESPRQGRWSPPTIQSSEDDEYENFLTNDAIGGVRVDEEISQSQSSADEANDESFESDDADDSTSSESSELSDGGGGGPRPDPMTVTGDLSAINGPSHLHSHLQSTSTKDDETEMPRLTPEEREQGWVEQPGPPPMTVEFLRKKGREALRDTRPPNMSGEGNRVPRFGVTARCLAELLKCAPPHVTTAEVCHKLILPATLSTCSTYTELLWDRLASDKLKTNPLENRRGQLGHFLGEADVFVSHAWAMPFADLVQTVEQHNAHADKSECFGTTTYYWIDVLSVNQHLALSEPRSPEWWAGTFAQAIEEMGTVLVVASPWERPTPLTRAWCIWEVFSAVQGNCAVHMEAPPRETDRLEAAVARAEGFSKAVDARSVVALEHAECTLQEDKDRIFKVVRTSDFGFEGVDSAVRGRLLGQLLCLAARHTNLEGARKCIALGAAAVSATVPLPTLRKPFGASSEMTSRRAGAAPAQRGQQTRWRAGALAIATRVAASRWCATDESGDFVMSLLDALTIKADNGKHSRSQLTTMLEVSDTDGMRALHWACAGDSDAAIHLACALISTGASVLAGRVKDGATPLALLSSRTCQLCAAKAIVENEVTPPSLKETAKQFCAMDQDTGPHLATYLLPTMTLVAVGAGLRVGNTSRELTDRRLACRVYVRAASGIPLAGFVSKVTYTVLRGTESEGCVEQLIEKTTPPFDWDCFLWGYFDTTVTVHWKKGTGLEGPLRTVHTIVWHDSSLRPSQRDTWAHVAVPPLEAGEVE
eukprot:m.156237 g.156237  ORF g.156237 m.156237 type:complete len:937 (-) comp14429_c0_seq4:1420-4230(-)